MLTNGIGTQSGMIYSSVADRVKPNQAVANRVQANAPVADRVQYRAADNRAEANSQNSRRLDIAA